MRKTKILSICISAFLSVGLIFSATTSSLSAKYSATKSGTLNVEFDTTGKFVADTLSGQFAGILNDSTRYDTLISEMNDPPQGTILGFIPYDLRDETYIGNVSGSNETDSQTIRTLFGLGPNETLILNGKPVTVMIKRENLDGDTATGEPSGDGNIQGAELTIYTTAEDVSGKSVEVYAMVFSKFNGDDETKNKEWQLVGQFVGTATTNNYTGSGESNSFNTATWKSTEVYYTEENTEIAIGTGLSDLVQSERLAQRNLSIIIAGGTVPA